MSENLFAYIITNYSDSRAGAITGTRSTNTVDNSATKGYCYCPRGLEFTNCFTNMEWNKEFACCRYERELSLRNLL